ncbi:hypothetical protein DFS34DRAFT_630419 [Phlyctochytrium arcticum]|nr:hypothetical protein DFS34DRAFT_630419 [Phlyctochytrium arcticum]
MVFDVERYAKYGVHVWQISGSIDKSLCNKKAIRSPFLSGIQRPLLSNCISNPKQPQKISKMSNSTILPPCDWRISVYNCHRGNVFLIIQYISLVVVTSALLAVIGTFYQRARYLQGRLWTSSGISSTEALLALIGLHFVGRIVTTVCLIRDNLSPGPMALLWEIPWLVGEVGLQSFVVGVATVSSNTRKFKTQANAAKNPTTFLSLPSKRTIYTAVYTQLAVQFLTNVPLAYFAGRDDYTTHVMAWPWQWYHIAHYSLWSVYLMLLSAAFLYYSLTLMTGLKQNSQDTKGKMDADSGVHKQVGRLRMQFLTVGFIYGSFGMILGSFAWLRHWILYFIELSAFLCLGWNTLVPTAMLVFCYVTYFSDRQTILKRDAPLQHTALGSGAGAASSQKANTHVHDSAQSLDKT